MRHSALTRRQNNGLKKFVFCIVKFGFTYFLQYKKRTVKNKINK